MAGTISDRSERRLQVADSSKLSLASFDDLAAHGVEAPDPREAFLARYPAAREGERIRPIPPPDVIGGSAHLFRPAPELAPWVEMAFLAEGAPFLDERNAHLAEARIAYLWAAEPMKRQGDLYCGTAEMATPPANLSGWRKLRFEHQFREWFGNEPYDFLITLWAAFALRVDDATFCATVLHELCHCGCERDEEGEIRRSRTTGRPKYRMKGHDVEEHVRVVEWFGAGASAGRTAELVAAAGLPPRAGVAAIAGACGTCRQFGAN